MDYGAIVCWMGVSGVFFLGGKKSAVGQLISTDLALGLEPTCR